MTDINGGLVGGNFNGGKATDIGDVLEGVVGGGGGGLTSGGEGFTVLPGVTDPLLAIGGGGGGSLGLTAEDLGIGANDTVTLDASSEALKDEYTVNGGTLNIFGGSGAGGGITVDLGDILSILDPVAELLGLDNLAELTDGLLEAQDGDGVVVTKITQNNGTVNIIGGFGGGGGIADVTIDPDADTSGGTGGGVTVGEAIINNGTFNVYGGAGGGANSTVSLGSNGGDGLGGTVTKGKMENGVLNIYSGADGGDVNDALLGVLGLDVLDEAGNGGEGYGGMVKDFTANGGEVNLYAGTSHESDKVALYNFSSFTDEGVRTYDATDASMATAHNLTNNGATVNLSGGRLTGIYTQTDGKLVLGAGYDGDGQHYIGDFNEGTYTFTERNEDGLGGGIFSGGDITSGVADATLTGITVSNSTAGKAVYAYGTSANHLTLDTISITTGGHLVVGANATLKDGTNDNSTVTVEEDGALDTVYTQTGTNAALNLAGTTAAATTDTTAININGGKIQSIEGDSVLAIGGGAFSITGAVTAGVVTTATTVTNPDGTSKTYTGGDRLLISGATVSGGAGTNLTAGAGVTLEDTVLTGGSKITLNEGSGLSGSYEQDGSNLVLANVDFEGGTSIEFTGTNTITSTGTSVITKGTGGADTFTVEGSLAATASSGSLKLDGLNVINSGALTTTGVVDLANATLTLGTITLGADSTLSGAYKQLDGVLNLAGSKLGETGGDTITLSGGDVISTAAGSSITNAIIDGAVEFSVDTVGDTLNLVDATIGGGGPFRLDVNNGVSLEDTEIGEGITVSLNDDSSGGAVGSLLGGFTMNKGGTLLLNGGSTAGLSDLEIHGDTTANLKTVIESAVAGSVLEVAEGGKLVLDGIVDLVTTGAGTLDLSGLTIEGSDTVKTVLNVGGAGNAGGAITLDAITLAGGEVNLGLDGVLDGAFGMTGGTLNFNGGTLGGDLAMNLASGAIKGVMDFGTDPLDAIKISGSGEDGMVTVGGGGSSIKANYAVSGGGNLTLLGGATMTGITMEGSNSSITLDGGTLTGQYTQYDGTLILGKNWKDGSGQLDFDTLLNYDKNNTFIFIAGELKNMSDDILSLTFDQVRDLFAEGFKLSGNISQHGVLKPGDTISVGDGGTVTLDDGTTGGEIDNTGGLITSNGGDGKASDIVIDKVVTGPSDQQGKIIAGGDGDTITTGILDMTKGGNLLSGAGSIVKEADVGNDGILTVGALGKDGKYVDGAVSSIETITSNTGEINIGAGADIGLADLTGGIFTSGAFEDSNADGVLDAFVSDPDAIAAIAKVVTDGSDFIARAGSDITEAVITGGESAVVGAFDMTGNYISGATSLIGTLTSTAKDLLIGAGSLIADATFGGETGAIGGFDAEGEYVSGATGTVTTLTTTADNLIAGAGSLIGKATVGGAGILTVGSLDKAGEYVSGAVGKITTLVADNGGLMIKEGSDIGTGGSVTLQRGSVGQLVADVGTTTIVNNLKLDASSMYVDLGAGLDFIMDGVTTLGEGGNLAFGNVFEGTASRGGILTINELRGGGGTLNVGASSSVSYIVSKSTQGETHYLNVGSVSFNQSPVLIDMTVNGGKYEGANYDIRGGSGLIEVGSSLQRISVTGDLVDDVSQYLSGLNLTSQPLALKANLDEKAAPMALGADAPPSGQGMVYSLSRAYAGMSATARSAVNAPAISLSQANIGMFELGRHFRALREANDSWKNDNCLDPTAFDIWAGTFTHHISVETGGKASMNLWGLDIGFDRQVDGVAGGSLYLGGVFGGQWLGNVDLEQSYERDGTGSGKSYSVGGYALWMNGDGWFANAALRHFWNDLDLTSYAAGGQGVTYDAGRNAFALSTEVGRKIDMSEAWYIEPSVGLMGTLMTGDSFRTSRGDRVDYSSTRSLEGTAGIALGYNGQRFMPYVEAAVIHGVGGKTDVRFNGDTFKNDPAGTRVRASLGANFYLSSSVSLSFDAAYEHGSKYRDINGNFGVNFSW